MNTGVYQIKNIINDKIYIGSSINLKKRNDDHFYQLKTNTHPNIHLQRSYNKHKRDSFEFIHLLNCPINELIMTEQIFINAFNPKYNICKIAGSSLGYKHTEESINKMTNSQMGVRPTNETKSKISKSHQKPVVQLTKDGKFIQEFDSIKIAEKALNLYCGGIADCCRYKAGTGKRKQNTAGGYGWIFKKQYESL